MSGGGTFPYGSQQTITATGNTGSYYFFNGWSDGNPNASRVVTIGASNASYTANFIERRPEKQPINLSSSGSGTVYINGAVLSNGDKFAPGTYTLTAVPSSGWTASWTTKSITIVDRDVPVSVTFTPIPKNYRLTINASSSKGSYEAAWVTVNGSESRGVITGAGSSMVYSGEFPGGSVVTLTRFKTHIIYNPVTYPEALNIFNSTSNFGGLFINGSSYGPSSTMTITMNSDQTINCSF